jgi:hypothetical protein
LELTSTNTLLIHWQGGVLQHSSDLLNWGDIPNANHPHAQDLTSAPSGFWRMRK